MQKIPVGVIGATGMVGQNYIRLLDAHPWFEVTYVAASPRSAHQRYQNAVAGRWLMATPIPAAVAQLIVGDANQVHQAKDQCRLIFSAVDMDKAAVAALESEYAAQGLAVVSNNSAHRHTPDVPMIIPEINPHHLEIIPAQRINRGWDQGLVAVKSNCSIQSYMAPVYALIKAGFSVSRMILTTLQALSGAGFPGPAAIELVDNIIPYIDGEDEKSEIEPLKILGQVVENEIVNATNIDIAAHCTRVPVTDGHTACVNLEFQGAKPDLKEIADIWRHFSGVPQELELPFAPKRPIVVKTEPDRPQPRKDRDLDKAMTVTVGGLRTCNVFDIRFVGLHHNTIRGAAGGAILTAELLQAGNYL
jgi:aspartate-semialdehyde dehydrogenase